MDGRTATIHVFCDASSRVFCCCAYVRITTGVTSRGEKDSEIKNEEVLDVLLITAKARVTPTKTDSISRLELAGCVLGVRLGNAIASAFEMSPEEINYWTDSTNCLYWITSPSSILKTFFFFFFFLNVWDSGVPLLHQFFVLTITIFPNIVIIIITVQRKWKGEEHVTIIFHCLSVLLSVLLIRCLVVPGFFVRRLTLSVLKN
jgi:hypothetical protein